MSPLSLTVSLPPPHLPRVSCCCQAPCRRSVLFWVKVLRADTPVSETWLAQCLVPGEACACHGGRLSVGLPSSVWALQAPALECRLLWGAARLCSPHLDAAASGGGGKTAVPRAHARRAARSHRAFIPVGPVHHSHTGICSAFPAVTLLPSRVEFFLTHQFLFLSHLCWKPLIAALDFEGLVVLAQF